MQYEKARGKVQYSVRARSLKRCFKRLRRGKIRPIVDRTFQLDEARDAQTYFKQRGK
ncbi:zinc-binding dehydrogenase, partial [Acinetobacter soli]